MGPRRPYRQPCSRSVVRLVVVATVLTTACVSSLQATVLSFDTDALRRTEVKGGPHPVEVRTLPVNRPIATNEDDMEAKMVARGDEISPCSPDHPNSIKGTGLFLSLQELDPDALVTDYFDAQSCQWDLLKLETYVVVTRLDAEKQIKNSARMSTGDTENEDSESEGNWDGDTSAYFDQVICVSGGVGTIWGMFNPPQRLIKLTAQCKEGGKCLGVFIGNLLIYVWCAIFLLGIPELVLVWVQCGWNQVAWLWVVWVTFFIARTQTAWIEYLRSSSWCRHSSFSFLCHVEDKLHDSSEYESHSLFRRYRRRSSDDRGGDNSSSSRGIGAEGLFNPHSLELFSGWERWDWVDLSVFAGMVVFVAGVSVQLLESCGWDCLAYFVLVVSGIDEVVWLWRSKRGSSTNGNRRGPPRSLILRRHLRRKGSSNGTQRTSSANLNGSNREAKTNKPGEATVGWGYGEGLGLHMWLWLAGAVVLCTWRASVALHLLFLFAFCVYHWTMKEKLPHLNF
mmetsp:Transcript_21075/g.31420  ORF Transcript_21075/g.31420 Transcript_21075/m.31420 type:complete len:509 (+) Transcript_21075:85-1611(+)